LTHVDESNFFISFSSTFKGLSFLKANFKRLETLETWVSTAILGMLNNTETTTFAVFLPTPGKVSKMVMSLGT